MKHWLGFVFWLVFVLLATHCLAQEIKGTVISGLPIVRLEPGDAVRVERAEKAVRQAQQAWEDLQKEISLKYLVVDKNDPDAGTREWYPPDAPGSGTRILTTWGSGSITLSNEEQRCMTADEKKAAEQEHAKYEAEQKRLQDEREAVSRRIRKGWVDGNGDVSAFEYSDDFHYIAAKKTPAPTYGGGNLIVPNTYGCFTPASSQWTPYTIH